MEIEKIIYDTTREIYSIEDKLSIAVIFLFCYKMGSRKFAELLYTNNHKGFVENLNHEYDDYEVSFSVRFDNVNVNNSFIKTLEKVKQKYDSDGFYKAVFNKDPFALVIVDIVNYNFSKRDVKKFKNNVIKQLELIF